ncbi:hypothetical protein HDU98_009314 [Podochytrium sp. JEL0797]|nr:hypothetical protein HDU98_009314 [Podochytrium sp. JEL0797]
MNEKWNCAACTFANAKPLAAVCEVCETPRVFSLLPVNPTPALPREHSRTLPPSANSFSNTSANTSSNTPLPSRAALEQERLARLASKRPREEDTPSLANKRSSHQHRLEGSVVLTNAASYGPSSYTSSTFAKVVQPQTLRKCFLSAFQFDLPWIAGHLPPHIPVCLALHNPTPSPPKLQNNICLVFPKLAREGTYSTMHVKIGVLFHDMYVRVVVTSANLVDYDWNDLENVVWMQDFPVRSVASGNRLNGDAATEEASSPLGVAFQSDLIDLLKEMEAQAWVWEALEAFDFSACKARLVVSRPGKFEGDEAFRYGVGRLSSIVHEVRESSGKKEDVSLLYQTSSLGSLSKSWLTDFESACRGTLFLNPQQPRPEPSIEIVFPTRETIQNSTLGPSGSGTITWNRAMWEKCEYKHLLRDAVSKRRGALSHCKILICESEKSGKNVYYYCGSHNMTMSAWGKPSVFGKKKERRVEISNWEVGVLLVAEDGGSEGFVVPFVREPLKRHGEGLRASHTR